jgi:hypothetical protein
LSIAKFPPFVAIFLGALFGGVVGLFLDPERVIAFAMAPDLSAPLAAIKGVWSALATGYVATSGYAPIDVILTRGGMSSMMNTVWLIITALAFGATVEHAGLLNRLIDPLIHRVKSAGGLVAAVVVTCIGFNVVTSDQYISIALPGGLFKVEFAKRGLAPVLLSRVVGDSATVFMPGLPFAPSHARPRYALRYSLVITNSRCPSASAHVSRPFAVRAMISISSSPAWSSVISPRRIADTSWSMCSFIVATVLGLPLILMTGSIGLPITFPCPVGNR